MAARASLLADGDEAVHRTRHRAAHEQEIALGVDLHDAQADLGEVAGAHVPRHPLAFDDARRVGARRDGSRLAVARIAVRLGTAVKVMAVHHALEAAALGHAAHFDAIAFGEDRDGDRRARGGRLATDREAANDARRDLEAGLLHVTHDRLRRTLRLLHLEAQLRDRKSTRLNSSHRTISYADFCLKKTILYQIASLTKGIRSNAKIHLASDHFEKNIETSSPEKK